MNKRTLGPVISSAFALVLVGCSDDPLSSAESVEALAEATQPGLSLVADKQSPETDHVTKETNVRGSEVLGAKHPNLLALSADEAAWLDRQNYPTTAELDALLTYDIDELSSALRNRKSQKAAVLLGHRKMLEGDISGAWSAFGAGASLGSLYAMQQLALITAHRATGLPIEDLAEADQGNLGVMVAQLQVARMLGDHRAQALIDRYAVNFDWDYYGKHVLAQTAVYMDQYGEFARARGEPVRGPDPRPNEAAWKNLENDPDALVTLYTRSRSYP